LKKQGCRVDEANLPYYVRICRLVLSDGTVESKNENSIVPDAHIGLRDVLYQLLRGSAGESKINIRSAPEEVKQLDRFLKVLHLSSIRRVCEQVGLKSLVTKQCVSLLRYSDLVPVDVAFYHAGERCREESKSEMALVFFNRFVDVTEMLEDEDGDIDETEFLMTDIPSSHKNLPKKSHFDEDAIEEIREWALTAGMSNNVQCQLPLRKCTNCGKKTYLAGVTCHNCKHAVPECIVTGWPVIGASNAVSCPKCHGRALKDAWNSFVLKAKACPWCEQRGVKPVC